VSSPRTACKETRHRDHAAELRDEVAEGLAPSALRLSEAKPTNGLYKAECVRGPDAPPVWDDDQLELETLSWVHWFNEDRLHGHCGDVPPAEFEAAFYAAQQPDPAGVGNQ
jgi:putative transposase